MLDSLRVPALAGAPTFAGVSYVAGVFVACVHALADILSVVAILSVACVHALADILSVAAIRDVPAVSAATAVTV